jgi:uncharacterized protein with PIN domain
VSPHRFLCDDNLGRLARWLRAAGFDCVFENPIDDAELLRRAREEDRIVLTRDVSLVREGLGPHRIVSSSDYREQLREVFAAYRLDPLENAFTRCIACNERIVEVEKETVRDAVPARSFAALTRFWRCPGCGRVLWRGSHVERTLCRLREILRHVPTSHGPG